jgi:hypothetical protein
MVIGQRVAKPAALATLSDPKPTLAALRRTGLKPKLAVSAAVSLAAFLVLSGCPAEAATRPAANHSHAQAAAASANGAWTIYHGDNAHMGYDSTQPTADSATTGWVSTTLDGNVYGEPLVYNGLVYVSTLQNTVYALNQSTGAVVWSRNLGAPQTSGWLCGNINPTGILGTGVIDTAGSRVYVVAFLTQYLAYFLFGLDLATGTIALEREISPNGFDWTIQQQRGALALSKDGTHVYIPFGGRAGDCGPYHAWVVGAPTNGGIPDELFEGPSTGAGSWAAGGVLVDDSTGHVFFATGNAIPCSGSQLSDSIIETNATLGGLSNFQPLDWQSNWCGPDWDLGSASPVLISPSLMFTSGKYGQGFLLNPVALGGTGGQLFPAQSPYVGADVCVGNHADATFGSFAFAAPHVYLECEGHGLVSLTVDTAAPSFSLCDSSCSAAGTWQAGGSATFGPPIVAGGVVWVVDINGGGLYGFSASTGAQIYHSAGFGVTHFSTPSEAGGQIFVSSDRVVRSFNMVVGCKSVTASYSPPSPTSIGTLVTVTGAASGCPNANPRYQFWLLPQGGTWSLVQSYSPSATYSWDTTGRAPGTYLFSVWARDASSAATYDAYDSSHYYSLSTAPCTAVSLAYIPASPSNVGTSVTVTGTASGCPNPRYQFWLLPPGGTWTLVQGYSGTATYNWSTTGSAPGSYLFSVWARDASSGASYDAYDSSHYYSLTTTACTVVSVAYTPASPSNVGTPVTVTGTASGCPNPRYQFWLLPPGGTWTLVQGYSSSASFRWSTTGRGPATYLFSVWARDASSTASYDAYDSSHYYSLTTAPCTAVSVAYSPASPSKVGTLITVTGTASGCPNPFYEFWLLPPGGTWTLVQGYSSSPTFSWSTIGSPPGTYLFSVWARDASSTGTSGTAPNTYDKYNSSQYYTLN